MHYVVMLWFNFILGSNLIFLCFGYGNLMVLSLKQRKIKFEGFISHYYLAMVYCNPWGLIGLQAMVYELKYHGPQI